MCWQVVHVSQFYSSPQRQVRGDVQRCDTGCPLCKLSCLRIWCSDGTSLPWLNTSAVSGFEHYALFVQMCHVLCNSLCHVPPVPALCAPNAHKNFRGLDRESNRIAQTKGSFILSAFRHAGPGGFGCNDSRHGCGGCRYSCQLRCTCVCKSEAPQPMPVTLPAVVPKTLLSICMLPACWPGAASGTLTTQPLSPTARFCCTFCQQSDLSAFWPGQCCFRSHRCPTNCILDTCRHTSTDVGAQRGPANRGKQ